MMNGYVYNGRSLVRQPLGEALEAAIWIDLLQPAERHRQAVEALGVRLPTREEMEEIEVSNRLYTEDGRHYMTTVMPGFTAGGQPTMGPVTFILMPERLVTLRHHTPRPFDTYPARAYKAAPGCGDPARIFLGLVEEMIGRLADMIEEIGRELDDLTRVVFDPEAAGSQTGLRDGLVRIGRQGERLNRIRLGLLSIERALGLFRHVRPGDGDGPELRGIASQQIRDLEALGQHGDYLSGRIGLVTDTLLGMINLMQNGSVKVLTVVSTLFLPPTLIGTIYGMNFEYMPELDDRWGYPVALALMIASAAGSYWFARRLKWL